MLPLGSFGFTTVLLMYTPKYSSVHDTHDTDATHATFSRVVPSGNLHHYQWENPLSMVIFHSNSHLFKLLKEGDRRMLPLEIQLTPHAGPSVGADRSWYLMWIGQLKVPTLPMHCFTGPDTLHAFGIFWNQCRSFMMVHDLFSCYPLVFDLEGRAVAPVSAQAVCRRSL